MDNDGTQDENEENGETEVEDQETNEVTDVEGDEQSESGLSSNIIILIAFGSGLVVMTTFLLCIYCKKNRLKSKENATIIPDDSINNSHNNSEKKLDDESPSPIKKPIKNKIDNSSLQTTQDVKKRVPALNIEEL